MSGIETPVVGAVGLRDLEAQITDPVIPLSASVAVCQQQSYKRWSSIRYPEILIHVADRLSVESTLVKEHARRSKGERDTPTKQHRAMYEAERVQVRRHCAQLSGELRPLCSKLRKEWCLYTHP